MNIAFILPSLAPGRTGVGDYVRGLAEELAGRGCGVCAVSVREGLDETLCESPCDKVSFLRLGREAGPQTVRDFFKEQRTEVVSLQYSPYGFHPKGMAWGLADEIHQLAGEIPLHLLFHEVWIGDHPSFTTRQWLVGRLQRWSICRMVRALSPRTMHSTNPAYLRLLAQQGIATERIAMFGAVPHEGPDADGWLPGLLLEKGLQTPIEDVWLAGFFGTLHPKWNPAPFMRRTLAAARSANKHLVLLSLGRMGSGQTLWKTMRNDFHGQATLIEVGELDAGQLGQAFRSLDFGVSLTPVQVLGKSSAAAAMLECGLPLVVPRDEPYPFAVTLDDEPQLILMNDQYETRLVAGIPHAKPHSRKPHAAATLLERLQNLS